MKRFETWVACFAAVVTGLLCLLLTTIGVWLLNRAWLPGVLCILCAVGMLGHVLWSRCRDR